MRYCTFWISLSHENVTLRWLLKRCARRAIRSNVSGCPRPEIGTASRDVEGGSQNSRGASNGGDTFHSLPSFFIEEHSKLRHELMVHGLHIIFVGGQCTSKNRQSRYHVSSELESQWSIFQETASFKLQAVRPKSETYASGKKRPDSTISRSSDR